MVDSINNNSINELQTSQNQQIQQINQESAGSSKANVIDLFTDKADISEAARTLIDREQETQAFAVLAQRSEEPFDSDKVSYFKGLLDSGKINDYLRGLNNTDLADNILGSPIGAALQ